MKGTSLITSCLVVAFFISSKVCHVQLVLDYLLRDHRGQISLAPDLSFNLFLSFIHKSSPQSLIFCGKFIFQFSISFFPLLFSGLVGLRIFMSIFQFNTSLYSVVGSASRYYRRRPRPYQVDIINSVLIQHRGRGYFRY